MINLQKSVKLWGINSGGPNSGTSRHAIRDESILWHLIRRMNPIRRDSIRGGAIVDGFFLWMCVSFVWLQHYPICCPFSSYTRRTITQHLSFWQFRVSIRFRFPHYHHFSFWCCCPFSPLGVGLSRQRRHLTLYISAAGGCPCVVVKLGRN